MTYAIAVPVDDSVPGECYASHLALALKMALGLVKDPEKDMVCATNTTGIKPHARARNFVFDAAMAEKVDRLLFVDADMLVPPLGANRLAKVMDETGATIVTGMFYQRGYPFACTWSKVIDGELRFIDPQPNTGVIELDATGLAFTLIDMNWVREHMEPPYFQMAVHHGMTLWEDGDFCTRVVKKGGKILGDTHVSVGHLLGRRTVHAGNALKLRLDHDESGDYDGGS